MIFKLFLVNDPITYNGVGGVEYLKQGVDELVRLIDQTSDQFPYWTVKQQTRGAIAAWDCGLASIMSHEQIDYFTSGQDFSSDIFSSAEYFAQNGY